VSNLKNCATQWMNSLISQTLQISDLRIETCAVRALSYQIIIPPLSSESTKPEISINYYLLLLYYSDIY
jgi:hypothetical protein